MEDTLHSYEAQLVETDLLVEIYLQKIPSHLNRLSRIHSRTDALRHPSAVIVANDEATVLQTLAIGKCWTYRYWPNL